MRTIIQILLSIAFCISLQAENRLIDDHTLLIDSYTSIKKDVLYYKMAEAWPGLKEPTTIIIDGDKLNELTGFKLMNGQLGEDYFAWHIKTVRIIPKSGTHVKITANADFGFCVHGVQFLTIDGTNNLNQGIYGMPYLGNLTGNFGFEVINWKPRGQCVSLSVLDGGKITLINFETRHGFCGLKINGYRDTQIAIYIENFYVHDTFDGEGFYIGSTQVLPVTKFTGTIYNGITTRTACEGIQLQHLGGLTQKNTTSYNSCTAVLGAFQQYQDTGEQWVCAKGTNRIQNCILDGAGSIGLNMFGGDGVKANNIIDNLIISGCRGQQLAFHKSCNTDANWALNNVTILQSNLSYFKPFTQIDVKVYNAVPVGADPLRQDTVRSSIKYNTGEAPKYVNSGFDGPTIVQWRPYYAPYLQAGIATVLTSFKRGDVVIDTTEGLYEFYLTLNDHVTDPLLSPRYNTANFTRIKWGNEFFPPDDLRCVNYPSLGIKVVK